MKNWEPASLPSPGVPADFSSGCITCIVFMFKKMLKSEDCTGQATPSSRGGGLLTAWCLTGPWDAGPRATHTPARCVPGRVPGRPGLLSPGNLSL